MEMRAGGLDEAIRAAGGIGALARALGISQPAVSNWRRVPTDRILQVEAATGVERHRLRPDLYAAAPQPAPDRDETDLVRAREYDLLALLLGRAPDGELLKALSRIEADASPIGRAHGALAQAARESDADSISREYFDLFVGLGRGELLPYGSYYLTGFLNERPLARLRDDLFALGIAGIEERREPEDHIAFLLETMAALADGRFGHEIGAEAGFFGRNLKPWCERFFSDLEQAGSARFYRHVGALGRLFMEIEAEAFELDA